MEAIRRRYESSLALLRRTKESLKDMQDDLQGKEATLSAHTEELQEILTHVEA